MIYTLFEKINGWKSVISGFGMMLVLIARKFVEIYEPHMTIPDIVEPTITFFEFVVITAFGGSVMHKISKRAEEKNNPQFFGK